MRKIGQFFSPVVTFSFVVTKRLRNFEKSFCDDTDSFCDSSEPSSFLKHFAQWSVKKTDFDGLYPENGKSYGHS